MQREVQRAKRAESINPGGMVDDESISISRSPSVQPRPSTLPGLNCLADVGPNERPPYSNFTLVKYAILGSPNQKLTLAEIYLAIADRFPWFQTAGKGWKNSVRHCLSLDTQFYKEPRHPTQCGKGCYWKVSLDTPRGNKRERKRNKNPTKREIAEALRRSRPPSSFPLTTPAFRDHSRDFATTVPVSSTMSSTMSFPPVSTQSGWTPYFPPPVMESAATPALVRHYAEVTCQAREIPLAPNTASTNPFKLSSASYWEDDDEVGSNVENEEALSQ